MNFSEAIDFIRSLRDSHLTVSEIQSRIKGMEFRIHFDEALLIDETLFGKSGGLWAHVYGNPLLGSVIVLPGGASVRVVNTGVFTMELDEVCEDIVAIPN